MADFLQTLIIAITLGSLYALIALGYTMVYGVLKLINFAHSDVVVLGAWISLTLSVVLLPRMGIDIAAGLPPWWAGAFVLIAAMVICGGIGFLIERLAYKPIRSAPRLQALITAIGVSLFLQNFGQLQYTIIPGEKIVASGELRERGQDPKTVRLASPITLEPGEQYVLRVFRRGDPTTVPTTAPSTQPAASPSASTFRIAADPGTYEAGKDIAIETPIGRSITREGAFQLLELAKGPALKLPFGAMPTAMPRLVAEHTVLHAMFVEHTRRTTTITRGKRETPATTRSSPDGSEIVSVDSGTSDEVRRTSESRASLATAGFGPFPKEIPQVAPPVGWESTRKETDSEIVDVQVGSFEKPVQITSLDITIVLTAAALMVGLEILVFRTRMGTAMRAVSYNMNTSALMGIPVDRVVSITFVIGTALAAAAGFLFALKYTQIQQPAHATWVLLGLKAFVAAVVGGIGNIRGATAGGFLIAFIEQFGAYAGQQAGWGNASAYTDVFVFMLLIIVLLVKPTGLFGSTVREKV